MESLELRENTGGGRAFGGFVKDFGLYLKCNGKSLKSFK